MKASDYVNVFKYHGKGLYALNRVWDTFKDVHLFDLKRGTDTAKIKTDGYTDSRYMIYMPVYTTVCREMIRKLSVSKISFARTIESRVRKPA